MQVLYPLVIEQLLKHESQREKPQKEENGLYCVPNGFAVIQKVDVGGDKVCTQTANFKMKLHDSVVGRRPL